MAKTQVTCLVLGMAMLTILMSVFLNDIYSKLSEYDKQIAQFEASQQEAEYNISSLERDVMFSYKLNEPILVVDEYPSGYSIPYFDYYGGVKLEKVVKLLLNHNGLKLNEIPEVRRSASFELVPIKGMEAEPTLTLSD